MLRNDGVVVLGGEYMGMKGEGGEEEEWRYGQVRSMTTTCGRESLANLGFREKQRWRRRMRRAWMCVG